MGAAICFIRKLGEQITVTTFVNYTVKIFFAIILATNLRLAPRSKHLDFVSSSLAAAQDQRK